jgi:hypothetical protein
VSQVPRLFMRSSEFDALFKPSPRRAEGGTYIWGGDGPRDKDELWAVCRNGCCGHSASSASDRLPNRWRYATEEEVTAGKEALLEAARLRATSFDELDGPAQ